MFAQKGVDGPFFGTLRRAGAEEEELLEGGGRGDCFVEGVGDKLGVKECVEGGEVDEDGFEELGS
jgi:hypothetical protein